MLITNSKQVTYKYFPVHVQYYKIVNQIFLALHHNYRKHERP